MELVITFKIREEKSFKIKNLNYYTNVVLLFKIGKTSQFFSEYLLEVISLKVPLVF